MYITYIILIAYPFIPRRQRDHKPTEPLYRALLNTVKIDKSQLTVQLVNRNTGQKLVLEVTALKDSTVRVKLRELEVVHERYQPATGDVLDKEPELDR